MPAFVDNMAYVGATPWHNLGSSIDGALLAAIKSGQVPVSELLSLAGLDWTVQTRSLAMRPADDSRDIFLTSQLEDYRAIVRSDTNQVFQVASKRYHPVQNEEIVSFFQEYCEAGHATIETLGSLKDGAVVWCLARLNGQASKVLDGLDELRGYMMLATSHDGSVTTTGKPTQVRVVCWNTLQRALGSRHGSTNRETKTFRMRHSRKFDASAKSEAQDVMGMAIEEVSIMNDIADKLSKVKIDARGRLEFLDRILLSGGSVLSAVMEETVTNDLSMDSILARTSEAHGKDEDKLSRVGKAILDAIIDSPGSTMDTANNTLWGAVNGVTWFADHVSKAQSDSNRLYSSWFGPNEGLKTRAVNVALEMAGR